MTNDERKKIVKDAQSNGYQWNSDGSKMVKGSSTITFSPTKESVKVNGSGPYNTPEGVKNSSNYNKK